MNVPVRNITLAFMQTVALDFDTGLLRRVLQQYADDHLATAWPVDALVQVGAPPPAGSGPWPMYFLDDADQAVKLGLAAAVADENGVLGYHADPALGPCGFVFLKTAAADGIPASVVASHELAELLVDPAANKAAYTPRNRFVAYEISDPVEGSTFTIAGLEVADFVTPAWFGEPGTSYDHLGHVTQPCELMPGGYALVTDQGNWTQIFGARNLLSRAAQAADYSMKDRRLRRVNRRRRGGTPACGEALVLEHSAAAPAGVVLA